MPDEARYEDIYSSEYLSPVDLQPGQSVDATFVGYDVRELYCKGQYNIRCTMTVKGGKKRICINKTSARALARAWGKAFADWINKPVTIRRGMVNKKPAILVAPKGERIEEDGE